MSDLISRQDAIDALDNIEIALKQSKRVVMDILDSEPNQMQWIPYEQTTMIYKLQDIPSTQRWIPMTERSPENEDWAIITVLDESGDTPYRYSDFAWYLKDMDCWIVDNERRTDVIAWMPLPAPYTESEVDDEDRRIEHQS